MHLFEIISKLSKELKLVLIGETTKDVNHTLVDILDPINAPAPNVAAFSKFVDGFIANGVIDLQPRPVQEAGNLPL